MRQIAIKTTWSNAPYNAAAQTQLIADITGALANAGCTITDAAATYVDWMPAMAYASTDTNDDTPHWALSHAVGSAQITAHAVHGTDYADALAKTSSFVADPGTVQANVVTRFYADAATGDWWLHVHTPADLSASRLVVGCRMRRYPADTTQGVHARYALLRADCTDTLAFAPPYLYPPYFVNTSGASLEGQVMGVYSPLAGVYNAAAQKAARHAGSPLPASAAPLFAQHIAGAPSACILGELSAVQLLSANDYTLEQELSPGWIALPGNANLIGLAVPSVAFTDVADARI